MKHKHVLTLAAAVAGSIAVTVPVAAAAAKPHATTAAKPPAAVAASTPTASLRVEGLKKTLIMPETVTTKTGSFTRSGHKTANSTALGLLNTASGGNWGGSWSKTYNEWEITRILSETHTFSSKDYWAFYVNGVQASEGASEYALKNGQHVVFAALPDAHYNEQLLNVTVSGTRTVGHTLTANVSAYNAKGKAVPLKGASFSYSTKNAASGVKLSGSSAKFKPTTAGEYTVKVSKSGYVRDELIIKVQQ